ncbi:ABC transporter permease [Amycolatopsis sp. 195334CR]|uniref:ABC transporter permease n=1 Tax=Amycolatopsis sp. 195334CR TaxID=2814588 RepID=UPI001A90376B|nr:ABC transporter permease [Amycolatopsis sp. 195334CR]MBN6038574.1 ABC transporter permease [Amycolatopsis sp. 195334CR]
MGALAKLTAVEAKLYLRDPGTTVVVLGIPLALLVVFGLVPGAGEPSEEFGGQVPLDTFIAPLAVSILLAILAVTAFPAIMAIYREKGVLRRLSASPVPPARLLTAQLLVNLAAALVVLLLIVGFGALVLGMSLPANFAGFAVVAVLGTAALFSVGLLIAALVPTGRAANGVGTAVFFPMLALGGVWVRKEDLPGFLQPVADVLPMGATFNGMRETWAGGSPELLQLGALALVTVVCAGLAARFFRWE